MRRPEQPDPHTHNYTPEQAAMFSEQVSMKVGDVVELLRIANGFEREAREALRTRDTTTDTSRAQVLKARRGKKRAITQATTELLEEVERLKTANATQAHQHRMDLRRMFSWIEDVMGINAAAMMREHPPEESRGRAARRGRELEYWEHYTDHDGSYIKSDFRSEEVSEHFNRMARTVSSMAGEAWLYDGGYHSVISALPVTSSCEVTYLADLTGKTSAEQ
jgi:hypothetical protein